MKYTTHFRQLMVLRHQAQETWASISLDDMETMKTEMSGLK